LLSSLRALLGTSDEVRREINLLHYTASHLNILHLHNTRGGAHLLPAPGRRGGRRRRGVCVCVCVCVCLRVCARLNTASSSSHMTRVCIAVAQVRLLLGLQPEGPLPGLPPPPVCATPAGPNDSNTVAGNPDKAREVDDKDGRDGKGLRGPLPRAVRVY
jgi:hypothetical protein